jgi:two-component system phosphate regulon sensor histidine kinase PhoR
MPRGGFFWRLFGAFGLLLAVALALLGWLIQRRVEAHLLGEIRRNLQVEAQLVQDLCASRPLSTLEQAALLARLTKVTSARITLISTDGTVLADSAEDASRMDNHLQRPEVQQALGAGTGSATRFSDTLHQNMLYMALRTEREPVAFVRLALPLGVVEEELSWLRGVIWTAAGITLAGALLLSLFLARRTSVPLMELADAARAIAAGAYGRRVTNNARDEVAALTVAFNEMSQACARHIEGMDQERQRLLAVLRSMVEGVLVLDAGQHVEFCNHAACDLLAVPRDGATGRKLWETVRHRELMELVDRIFAQPEPQHDELEVAGTEPRVLTVHGTQLPGDPIRGAVLVLHDITPLRKLERVRQDFVANASHELKTPLAAIQATAETLLDGAHRDPEHAVHFLECIKENAERLHRLVRDLLTLGRVEAGKEQLEIGPVPLLPVVEATLARVEPQAQAKNLRLECLPPQLPVTVRAEEEALCEILDNLVENAIKYTPSGGQVTVRWRAEAREAILEIADTGIGIPDKDLSRIFERFYRVDRARSRELGGTGLGLSIVKHLAQSLGGSISVTSQVGTGSTFAVRMPLEAVGPDER